MTIAKLAKAGGVGVETVRYYQRRGLMAEPDRPAGASQGGGFRRYGEEDVRRLRFIRQAQTAGFTLEQIGELLALDAIDDRSRAREMARARVVALDAEISRMEAARNALARLADDCGSGSSGPCPILQAFEER
jgi:MerR family mercuric resistance operon transcriptional regulator